ncbi:hypothetical protein pb186bvf_015945 [Paramecium bursaria]
MLKPPNLILSDQILNEDSCGFVADFITKNPQFINIELRGCNINPRGFERICRALPLETRQLLAEWNAIGSGVSVLCDILMNPSCQIQLVDLKNNRIQGESCARIGQMLKQNQNLQSLNLKWNEIGEKGAQFIWEALHYNRTLKYLDISCNKVPEGLAQQIKNKVDQNRGVELIQKNQQSIKDSQNAERELRATESRSLEQVRTLPKAAALAQPPQKKNDQIRVVQLKEQIDNELRANRLTTEELSNRMNSLKQDVMNKEQAVAMSKRRYEELLNNKAILEAEANSIKQAFDYLAEKGDERQQVAMNEYIAKNKYVLGLENDYMRELSNLRNDSKVQVEQIHQQWAPRLHLIESRYTGLMKINDRLNQDLLQFKELFLKMRLDHDESLKIIEQRILIEEKNKYHHQLEILKRKDLEASQDVKSAQVRGEQIKDDLNRLETQINKDRQTLEDQIQYDRDEIHVKHLEMSKRSIKQEKYINRNMVQDSHIEKLIRKIQELNHYLTILKDSLADDLQKRRAIHEQEYMIHKQNQNLSHQRTLDLELMLRNQEASNNKIKADYERLCNILQSRIQTTVADVCRAQLNIR